MKKFVIIGLLFAALVFGSCGELQKGGKIKVKNESSDYPVKIYVTKSAVDGMLFPPTDEKELVTNKTINANTTGEISINDDGIYYVRAFYIKTALGITAEVLGKVKPAAMVTLLAGNTVSVTAEEEL